MLEPLRRTFVKALKYVPSKNEFDSLVAEWNEGIDFVQKISDETRSKPTVDAAPVVRCKDCKKYFNRTCKLDVFNWKEEDFCSLGERKDVPNEARRCNGETEVPAR